MRTINLDNFGDWSLSEQVFGWVLTHIPPGGTILELGFGKATGELVRAGYCVYSVESCDYWAEKRVEYCGNVENHTLIKVPIVNKWYDHDKLKAVIPSHYDLLIIDGPDTEDRGLTLRNLDLFNDYSSVIIDDYCELYDTAKVAAYFAAKNGVAWQVVAYSNKQAICIKGRGKI
jgi:hypothetical protein